MMNQKNENGNENKSNPPTGAHRGFYEIHVQGHLDDSWSDWLEGLEVKCLDTGEMILFGHIGDQAALMGVLNKLHRLNLTLLAVSEANNPPLSPHFRPQMPDMDITRRAKMGG
jgi:hypothetical protein